MNQTEFQQEALHPSGVGEEAVMEVHVPNLQMDKGLDEGH